MRKISCLLLSFFAFALVHAQQNKFNLIVGTYNRTCESKGMYVYEFDSNSGHFILKNNTENVSNPSYLSVSKDNKFVYSVNQNSEKNSSAVSSFKYNSQNGNLDFINKQNVKAEGPCFIIDDDKCVITANYFSGSVSVFGKNNDGSLTEIKQVIQHQGKSIHLKNQLSAHAHMVAFSPDHKYVLVSDLGTDIIYLYDYNPNSGTEILKLKDTIAVKSGSGPRHFTFSEDGKYVYLIQELDGTLTSFKYVNGKLKKVNETSVVASDFKGEVGAADIHISPDGKFLYATNRGDANDISVFKILKKGKLEFVQRTSTLGKGPRNFTIDPTGNFLLIGHQFSNEITIFKRDKVTGSLTNTGKKIELCSPVCLVFTKI